MSEKQSKLYKALEQANKKYHFGLPIIILSEHPTKEEIEKAFETIGNTANEKDEWFLEHTTQTIT